MTGIKVGSCQGRQLQAPRSSSGRWRKWLPLSGSVNWSAGAYLCRRSLVPGAQPDDLFRGHLVEAIHLALERPVSERPRLFVRCETIERKLPWSKIAQLAARDDFPGLI